ncbi:hypothetical protein [Xylophilus sp.]|uniref:hypothetical protein n=1 Tax=Xylophilus sp. TaxID=2653893 RepID=UPI0013B9D0D7|nr:hypothetical protein [Xylophilus sp.]KAF1047819.1 MAG: hypothetical protein GAK38_01762 [Xylophilus sp.]
MSVDRPTPPEAATPAGALAGFVPTPAEQAVLDRIAAQRKRLRDERAEERALALAAAQARAAEGSGPQAVLGRVLRIVRRYPALTAAVTGGGITLVPWKIVRWGRILLPVLLRLRRR